MELTQGSETSVNYILTPGKYPKEYIQYSNHGESLKSRINRLPSVTLFLQNSLDCMACLTLLWYSILPNYVKCIGTPHLSSRFQLEKILFCFYIPGLSDVLLSVYNTCIIKHLTFYLSVVVISRTPFTPSDYNKILSSWQSHHVFQTN